MKKNDYGESTGEIFKQNEKIIKFATIFCIAYSIIFMGLIITWIYYKTKGI